MYRFRISSAVRKQCDKFRLGHWPGARVETDIPSDTNWTRRMQICARQQRVVVEHLLGCAAPGEDTDEAGEVHVDTAPDGDVQLEDSETRCHTDTGECDLMGLDTALSDPIDDSTDEPCPQQRSEDQCPQRERAFSEVNVCHSWLLICVSDILLFDSAITQEIRSRLSEFLAYQVDWDGRVLD